MVVGPKTEMNDSLAQVSLTDKVLINARLLDTSFVKHDLTISKKINYDAYMGIDRANEMGPFYDFFHYEDTCINGVHMIRPYGKYVGDYYLHDSITIQDGGFLILGEEDYTNQHYPVLDVTIVNNSSQTILVNELLIEVERSQIDPNPFVIIRESGGKLTIEDWGWKSWKNATFRFSLLPEGVPFNGKYKFKKSISSTCEPISIPLYDYFVRSGIDFSKFCTNSLVFCREKGEIPYWIGSDNKYSKSIDSLRSLLLPVKLKVDHMDTIDLKKGKIYVNYIDPYLVLYGELTFDNKSTLKVGGTVRFLTSEGWGAGALDCSRVYDVKLKNEGKDYVVKYPVSRYIEAGGVDRFAIQVNADKTSYHTFRVRLNNDNQVDIKTDPINLLIFKYNFDRD